VDGWHLMLHLLNLEHPLARLDPL